MRIADREGLDVAIELRQRGPEVAAFERQRAVKEGFRLIAGRAPDGALAHIANMVDHRVERIMGLRPKRLPVGRVEVFGGAVLQNGFFGIGHSFSPALARAGAVKACDLSMRRASPGRSFAVE